MFGLTIGAPGSVLGAFGTASAVPPLPLMNEGAYTCSVVVSVPSPCPLLVGIVPPGVPLLPVPVFPVPPPVPPVVSLPAPPAPCPAAADPVDPPLFAWALLPLGATGCPF